MFLSRLARPCLLLVLACTLVSTLTGCGMSEEDKDYYLRGWIRPTDLDRPSPAEIRRRNQAVEDPSVASAPSGPVPAVGAALGNGSY